MMNNSFIQLINVTKIFRNKKIEVIAIEDLNLSIKKNEFVSVVGPSGCGKSTLVNLIAGFIDCDRGSILYRGEKIENPSSDRTVVFQEDATFPWMTVAQNILYGPKLKKMSKENQKEILMKYLTLVELEMAEEFYPKQLSGGMKKRVDLARAYANNPATLLMDEPFGSLDIFTRKTMRNKLLELWEAEKKTVVFVTHDIEEAIFLSDRLVVLTRLPGKIKKVIDIPFERPRNTQMLREKRFFHLKDEIESLISNFSD